MLIEFPVAKVKRRVNLTPPVMGTTCWCFTHTQLSPLLVLTAHYHHYITPPYLAQLLLPLSPPPPLPLRAVRLSFLPPLSRGPLP